MAANQTPHIDEETDRDLLGDVARLAPSWIASGLFHLTVLIIAALVTWSVAHEESVQISAAMLDSETEPQVVDPPIEIPPEPKVPLETNAFVELPTDTSSATSPLEIDAPAESIEGAEHVIEFSDLSAQLGEIGCFTVIKGLGTGTGPYGDRGNKPNVPDDVPLVHAMALRWLAQHQLDDGGWSFDHRTGCCQGRCADHGSLSNARIGATALALLPFLGAGHTHQKGKYKAVVNRGLAFLGRKMNAESGSLHESGGTMYSHGLAAIALCEAYAMTEDCRLHAAAQKSLDFIAAAQDLTGGGWRYQFGQSGDTSAVGWQIMALKSGILSSLNVNPLTIARAARFLDSVESESGAYYGYRSPGRGSATTAIGLLSRMHMGWPRDHAALVRGVKYLSTTGPSKTNMYYNYYATQVIRHYDGDGPIFKAWDKTMRSQLISSQAKNDHAAGSWYFGGADHGAGRGGRLYATAMATMILEVYYRHQPLYQTRAVDEGF
jgi:hypothetical protein